MSKNIVLFIRSLELGGAEKQAILLSEQLSKNYQVTLLVFYQGNNRILDSLDFSFSLYSPQGNLMNKIFSIFRFLKKNKTHIIFNYLPINNILGAILGKICGVKFIVNGIRGSKTNKNVFKMRAQRFVGNRIADLIVSNSHKGKQSYVEYGFREEKIKVIPNMISNSYDIDSRKAKSYNQINILTVARFVPEKDFETLFKAFYELRTFNNEVYDNVLLTVVGYGKMEKDILSWITDYNLEKVVKIIDGRSEIKDQYKMAHIYISTSKYEGMSNTIMEAMSFGLPIIATNAGDSECLVKDGVNGFICNIGDHQMIANKINRLINDDKERELFGKKSYEYINKGYSIEKIGSLYEQLIEDL